MLRIYLLLIAAIILPNAALTQAQSTFYTQNTSGEITLNEEGATHFADLALSCIQKEYPKAELMSKILPSEIFESWFAKFLPKLDQGKYEVLLHPAIVSDRTDPKIVHLDGLNLSRAWCMQHIAEKLHPEPVSQLLYQSARYHLKSTLPYVASGDYAGEHWLASFAVLALTGN
jgi:hypothetical protein